MKMQIEFHNAGGLLDREECPAVCIPEDNQAAAEIAIRMIREAGTLYPGDKIVVVVNKED
jgi:hypothetical protein